MVPGHAQRYVWWLRRESTKTDCGVIVHTIAAVKRASSYFSRGCDMMGSRGPESGHRNCHPTPSVNVRYLFDPPPMSTHHEPLSLFLLALLSTFSHAHTQLAFTELRNLT